MLHIIGPRITGRSCYYIGGSAGNRPRMSNTSEKNSQLIYQEERITTHSNPFLRLPATRTHFDASSKRHSYAAIAEAGPEHSGSGLPNSSKNPWEAEKSTPTKVTHQHRNLAAQKGILFPDDTTPLPLQS